MALLIRFDTTLFYFINNHISFPLLDGIMKILTALWELKWLWAVAWVGFMIGGGKRIRTILLGLVPLFIFSDFLPANVLKPLLERDRPFLHLAHVHLLVNVDKLSPYGFPSNHAANSAMIAVYLSLCFKNRWLTALLLAGVAVVCFSRVYIGVHYPADVACGAIYGALIGWAGSLVFNRFLGEKPPSTPAPSV